MQKTGWTIHSFFLVLSGLKKSFTLDVITRGQSTTIFLCIGPFSAWWRTNKQTNSQVILVQACSWPVWEGSLLQNDLAPLTALSAHIGPQYQHRTFVWMLVQSQGCTMNIQRRINSIWHQRAKCHHHCLDLKNSKLPFSLPIESLSNQGIKTLLWATYQGNPSKTT